MILLLIVLLFVFGGGFGYWGHNRWGNEVPWSGPGIGIGTILIILLLFWILGGRL
jgi:hypothetical protein